MNSDWHTSSFSANGAHCVEVRERADGADVRDTKNRELGHLGFDSSEWRAFIQGVRSGEL
ncbi:DUF397 domain-containing protein [Nocardiopsis sediminis]|uniref:DUF397 domain-containing protein n=1 Tax=Nocardiopsis sediminis TaxID=1778267 RepID=A0ABV8FLW1_9ACTN